jgi:hypothetical protein
MVDAFWPVLLYDVVDLSRVRQVTAGYLDIPLNASQSRGIGRWTECGHIVALLHEISRQL